MNIESMKTDYNAARTAANGHTDTIRRTACKILRVDDTVSLGTLQDMARDMAHTVLEHTRLAELETRKACRLAQIIAVREDRVTNERMNQG